LTSEKATKLNIILFTLCISARWASP